MNFLNTIPEGAILGTVSALSATTGSMVVPMVDSIKTITPTGACTFNAISGIIGRQFFFIITTTGTTSFVLTWGNNFKTTATLATGIVAAKIFAVGFTCTNGTQWVETSRTTAM